MNARQVAAQGCLAGVALIASYFTWQREPELASGEVFALDVTKNDLVKVRFENAEFKAWAELSRGTDDEGPFAYVTISGHDMSNIPMPAGHPSMAVKVPDRKLRGNPAALNLLERFAPLRASRALGVLDAAKLKELGLDSTKKRIEVTARGRKQAFAIVPAPPGGTDPYLRNETDGRVFIVSRQVLTDLESAQNNLVDRALHAFRLETVDRIGINAAGKKRDFQTSREGEFPGLKFSAIGSPDQTDQTVKNWHDRIWALFPTDVYGQGELPPPGGTPQIKLRLDYSSRGRALGYLEIAKPGVEPQPGQSTSEAVAGSDALFARSEHSAGWAKLSPDAANLLSEAESMVTRKQ